MSLVKIWKKYKKIIDLFSNKKMAVVFLLFFLITILPAFYVGFFDYANGDDLVFGATVRNGMYIGKSISEILSDIYWDVRNEYLWWQGVWSSALLRRIEPSIWGEKFYIIVPFIAYFSLIFCPGYFLYEILVRNLKIEKSFFVIYFSIFSFFIIQFMPRFNSGIYWYSGMIHYSFSFGLSMLIFAFAIRFIHTGMKRYLIAASVLMLHIGGAGYPEVVLAALGFFLIIFYAVFISTRKIMKKDFEIDIFRIMRNRSIWLSIPFLIEMGSFYISAKAPGNSVRGGTEFGFSISKLISTVFDAFIDGIMWNVKYCFDIRTFLIFVLFVAVISWEAIRIDRCDFKFAHPIIASVVMVIITGLVHVPEIYAGDVSAGFSGGIYNSYYFTIILCTFLEEVYIIGWIKSRFNEAINKNSILSPDNYRYRVLFPALICVTLLCVIFSKHLIGKSLDYCCVNFISSGQLEDFDEQMKERIALLEDPNVSDVVVPEMNYIQGPFMHMALVDDPKNYTNECTALFYGKNSVIAIPREEYYELYGIEKAGE